MNYRIEVLTKESLQELKDKGLAWKSYEMQYNTVAVFPPTKEKPLICTMEMWKNYYKPLWDKCIYTYNPQKAYESCANRDEKWGAKYRTEEHLREVYEDKVPDYQIHRDYQTSWINTSRKTWTRNERAEFRHTDKWINFRNCMVLKHNCRCQKCGNTFPNEQLECHHLIEDVDYDNLTPSRFLVLCLSCHDKIHHYDEIRETTPIIKVKKVKKIKKVKKVKKITNAPIGNYL